MKSLLRSRSAAICSIIVLALLVCAGAYGAFQPGVVSNGPLSLQQGPYPGPDCDVGNLALLQGPYPGPDCDVGNVAAA